MRYTSEITGKFTLIIFFCSAIGVELAHKNITNEEVPQLLHIINSCFIFYIFSLLNLLITFKIITDEESLYLFNIATNKTSKACVKFANLGFAYASGVKIKKFKNGRSPFLNYLIQLKSSKNEK